MIKAAGIDKTILGSDLGQVGNPSPVDGFRAVINMCLDLGYNEQEIHQLVSKNASKLMGI
jgi:microsomal dipeptidase-like Zn-dependent dipeptidase